MIERRQFDYLNRVRKYGGTEPRACGQTFRNRLQAAHAASVGERVTLWCHTEFIAKAECRQFMDMFNQWGFYTTAPGMVRQRHSNGFVLFYGLPISYHEYERKTRGNNTLDIFDI